MRGVFLKRCTVIIFLLGLVHLVAADLFVVSVDKWVNCKDYTDNITICQKNPTYNLIEKNVIPNINTRYYDSVLDEVMKSKNEKIDNLENKVTTYATYNSEVTNLNSATEKVYLIGLALLSLLLVNAYRQIYKLKRQK